MTLRPLRFTSALALGAVMLSACGQASAEGLSAEAREALRTEIRAYLMEHPEVIAEAIGELEKRRKAAEAAKEADLVADLRSEIGDDGYSHVMGDPEGDVTVVEFLDYNCGYCKRAHEEVTSLVRIDGNIRYVVKEFPILGPGSRVAAEVAMAALEQDPDAYEELHDELMRHRGRLDDAAVWKMAEEAGLDMDRLRADAASEDVKTKIARTYALAKRLRIEGTPTFVIGDRVVRGYVPLATLQEEVAAAREASKG